MFFGPRCPALQPGSTVNHRFLDAWSSAPIVAGRIYEHAVPIRHLEKLSKEMVSEYIQKRIVEDSIAPKTANRVREVLHRMFSYAIEHFGYVCPDNRYRNPIQGVRRLREPTPVITWLTEEQIFQQIEILRNKTTLQTIVATLIYAGLRRSEALWLTTDDVDIEKRLIYVRAKTVDGEYWQPKTKHNRTVPISIALHEILKNYRPERKAPWFFPSPKGKRWDPDNFSEDLRDINRSNGLNWSSLDFRHTFGSHLAQKGKSLYQIAKLMGNSPEICRKHYAALVTENMHDAVEFGNDTSDSEGNKEDTLKQILEKVERLVPEERKPKLRIVKSHG
jgi:integrase